MNDHNNYQNLHSLTYYTLKYNPEYDPMDDSDSTYLLVNNLNGAIEYRSMVYPMALEAMFNLNNGLAVLLKKIDEETRNTEEPAKASVTSIFKKKKKDE